uniref:Uncharacterized protein n=1 Tax=Anguilla anguilla TaxID=7936 RepID=A0A0E9WF82_ANGAN
MRQPKLGFSKSYRHLVGRDISFQENPRASTQKVFAMLPNKRVIQFQ